MVQGRFIMDSKCSEQTQWFFRLQLMNLFESRRLENIISMERLDVDPKAESTVPQEVQYRLTEELLWSLCTKPDCDFTQSEYEKGLTKGTQWKIDTKEGITLVIKCGSPTPLYYVEGTFALGDHRYKVSAEFKIPRHTGKVCRLLAWLDGESNAVLRWAEGYSSLLPTGKNDNRQPIVGETFSGKIRNEDFSGLTFEECTFKNVSFIDVNLSGTKFRKCTFTNVNFRRYRDETNARFTTVEDCIFDQVSLGGSVWTGTVWHNCQFVTPLSMRPYDFKEPDFDYETYEKCRKSGDIFFPTGTPDLYERHLPGTNKPNRFIRPAKDGDYLIPLHDKFTYVPIDGAYMLVGDKGLIDGSVSPTNEMLWDAFRISRPNVDNPLGLILPIVW